MRKISLLVGICILAIMSSGCLKRDSLENIDIYTTTYPIEYITQRLYGNNSTINSIYPDGIIIDDYELTNKQIKDYSKTGLYIFNGLSYERNYVGEMFKYNKGLKIINSSESMEFTNGMEELWLDPSNFLMLAQNIRTGFNEYISNHYLKTEIEEKYNQLKIDVSNLDAKIKLMIESADNKTIVVADDTFKFLEKYNFNVISLEENDNLTEKTVEDVKKMIANKQIHYIFLKQHQDQNDTVKKIVADTKVATTTLHSLSNLTESERNSKKDYISIMNENIELLKQELYN